MNTFKNIRFVLIGMMVIGCFANFAQNDYGRTILYTTEFLIGLTFLIETFAFSRKSKGWKGAFLFTESIAIGILLMALSVSGNPSPFPRLTTLVALLVLLIIYLSYGIRVLVKQSKNGRAISLIVFILILITLFGTLGLSIKIQHWPGANVLLGAAAILAVPYLLLAIFKVKFNYKAEKLTIKQRINKLPGKIKFTFLYFTIWAAYLTLSITGFVPHFYTMSNPPGAEKIRMNAERYGAYWDNYDNFWENVRRAEEK